MGLSEGTSEIYCNLVKQRLLSAESKVVELGRQQLSPGFFAKPDSTNELCSQLGKKSYFEVSDFTPPPFEENGRIAHLESTFPYAEDFYRHLGMDYACIDFDEHSVNLDLNFDKAPDNMRQKFNLTTNYGTTEHIVNQANAFEVIHDLTVTGGTMIHTVPFQGFVRHGLFNYTFQFFWMLARSNMYEVIDASLSFYDAYSLEESKHELDFVNQYSGVLGVNANQKILRDSGITIILKKTNSENFVYPLDAQVDAEKASQLTKKRYWSLFPPNTPPANEKVALIDKILNGCGLYRKK